MKICATDRISSQSYLLQEQLTLEPIFFIICLSIIVIVRKGLASNYSRIVVLSFSTFCLRISQFNFLMDWNPEHNQNNFFLGLGIASPCPLHHDNTDRIECSETIFVLPLLYFCYNILVEKKGCNMIYLFFNSHFRRRYEQEEGEETGEREGEGEGMRKEKMKMRGRKQSFHGS